MQSELIKSLAVVVKRKTETDPKKKSSDMVRYLPVFPQRVQVKYADPAIAAHSPKGLDRGRHAESKN